MTEQQTQNQEQTENQEIDTLGSFLTQPLMYTHERKDINTCRLLFGAVLNILHQTLNANQNKPACQAILSHSINETTGVFAIVERSLAYCDEIVIEEEPEQESE